MLLVIVFVSAPWLLAEEKTSGDASSTATATEAFPQGSAAPLEGSSRAKRGAAPKGQRVIRRVKEPATRARRVQPDAEVTPKARALPEVLGRPREGRANLKPETERFGDAPAQASLPGVEVSATAPYGRLIKCELVFTVDSIHLDSPIVALCTEDVWWNGELIVPAGTEVLGRAVPNRVLNRIGDDGKWTLVLPEMGEAPNGRELVVKGLALDREEIEVNQRGEGRSWAQTDGSAGLQGLVIDEAKEDRVRLLLTAALSGGLRGLGRGLQTRVAAAGNAGARGQTLVPSTLRNAGLEAAGGATTEALDILVKEILAEVQRNGAYVRVPAGKTFYLFVDQTLELSRARLGVRKAES